jgi:hypothetical protein
MAHRAQKAPHASPEGGAEDNSHTPPAGFGWAYPLGGASRWAARRAAVLRAVFLCRTRRCRRPVQPFDHRHRPWPSAAVPWMAILGGRPVTLSSFSAGVRRRRRPVSPFAHNHSVLCRRRVIAKERRVREQVVEPIRESGVPANRRGSSFNHVTITPVCAAGDLAHERAVEGAEALRRRTALHCAAGDLAHGRAVEGAEALRRRTALHWGRWLIEVATGRPVSIGGSGGQGPAEMPGAG